MPKVLNYRNIAVIDPKTQVYVGRPSKWGNPYPMSDESMRKTVIEAYEGYIKVLHPELIEAAKIELKGKDLVCYCAPKACHADILLKIANEE